MEENGIRFLRSVGENGNGIDRQIPDNITSDQMGFLKRLSEHEISTQ